MISPDLLMNNARLWLAAIAVTCACPAGATSRRDPDPVYEEVVEGVRNDLLSYHNCVVESLGRDSCSKQFSGLEQSQERFTAEVAQIQHERLRNGQTD